MTAVRSSCVPASRLTAPLRQFSRFRLRLFRPISTRRALSVAEDNLVSDLCLGLNSEYFTRPERAERPTHLGPAHLGPPLGAGTQSVFPTSNVAPPIGEASI